MSACETLGAMQVVKGTVVAYVCSWGKSWRGDGSRPFSPSLEPHASECHGQASRSLPRGEPEDLGPKLRGVEPLPQVEVCVCV